MALCLIIINQGKRAIYFFHSHWLNEHEHSRVQTSNISTYIITFTLYWEANKFKWLEAIYAVLLLQCGLSVAWFLIYNKPKLFSFRQRMTLSLEVPLKVVLEPMPSSSREKPPSSLGDIKSKRTAGSWIDAPAFAVLSRSESLWGGSRILLNPGRLFSNLSLSNSRFSSFLSCKSCLSRLRSVVTWEKGKYRNYS